LSSRILPVVWLGTEHMSKQGEKCEQEKFKEILRNFKYSQYTPERIGVIYGPTDINVSTVVRHGVCVDGLLRLFIIPLSYFSFSASLQKKQKFFSPIFKPFVKALQNVLSGRCRMCLIIFTCAGFAGEVDVFQIRIEKWLFVHIQKIANHKTCQINCFFDIIVNFKF